MTLAQLAEMEAAWITPEQAASVLGCNHSNISTMAQTEEGRAALGFHVIRIGSHTKIPRAPFLRTLGWEGPIRGVGNA